MLGEANTSAASLAHKHGPPGADREVEGTLGNWVAKARENGGFKERPLDVSERVELERTRKELQQVKMERDFLKKAAASCSGHPC